MLTPIETMEATTYHSTGMRQTLCWTFIYLMTLTQQPMMVDLNILIL